MSDDMIKYSQQLRRLIDEYYHQHITMDDYRAQRTLIFDHIEKEFTGGNIGSEALQPAALDESTSPS